MWYSTAGCIVMLTLSLLTVPLTAQAQPVAKMPRIGVLLAGFPPAKTDAPSAAATPGLAAFRQGLRDLGYVEGQTIVIESRWAEGQVERLPGLAADLVRLRVDCIVAGSTAAAQAAKHVTNTLPIVMAVSSDPVGDGLVASLARPGGNITGLSMMNPELTGKRLALLTEAVPAGPQPQDGTGARDYVPPDAPDSGGRGDSIGMRDKQEQAHMTRRPCRTTQWSRRPIASAPVSLPLSGAAHRGRSASMERQRPASDRLEETTMWYSTVGCIVTLTLRLLTAPLASEAPQAEKVHQIGLLGLGCTDSPRNQYHREVFLQGLRAFGWVEGQNLAVACRSPRGRAELLPDLAAELVQLKVEVIVTGGERQSLAAKHATSTIPIVMAVSAAPVETGLVANLAQPGGNVTGLSIMAPEGGGKRLELLKDAVPQASRVAVLWNAAIPGKALEWQATQAAAQTVGVTLHSVEVRGPDDFDAAFVTIARERPDALIVFSEPVAAAHQRRIVDFATQHRLPMISETEEFAEMGALMTYGASLPALIRRAAYYVDRILKGAKPADLPVEQPRELALVINRTTAQALGLTLPPHLLFLADRVIQ